MKNNIIRDKSFNFSINLISLYRKLINQKEYIISKQLLRSGTSIGANIEEAIAAQSKKDFVSKMTIASKEARESKYWIMLLTHSQIGLELNYSQYLEEIDSIINILTKIVKTSSSNISKLV